MWFDPHDAQLTCRAASVAEWSMALRSGRSLFGGVGSNPTGCTSRQNPFFFILILVSDWSNGGGVDPDGCGSCQAVSVAQWIRRETTNLEIAGSNPVGDIFRFQTKIEFYILLRSSQILMVTRICNHVNCQPRPSARRTKST